MDMDIEKAIDTLNHLVFCGSCTTGPCKDCDRKNAKDTAIQGLQELQQYRQIGTVDECRVTMDELIELQEYRKLGTVKECWESMEKQVAKEPKRIYKKHGKHKWQRTESGKIDECAWDYGNHNGVSCEICGATVCVCCNPNYDELEDCEEEYYLCPNCGEKVPHFEYCKCGQALKWGD